jgi:hypothetical protein
MSTVRPDGVAGAAWSRTAKEEAESAAMDRPMVFIFKAGLRRFDQAGASPTWWAA